jgi:hypothetical protein
MKDSIMPFNELLKKGNRRGIRSKLPTGVDSARYRIKSITKLMYAPNSTSALVSLEPGFHFEVSKDGWIQWLAAGDNTLADGSYYTVLYDFHPVYQIVSHPHLTRDDVQGKKQPKDTVISLPIQGAAKLEFLIDVNSPIPEEC